MLYEQPCARSTNDAVADSQWMRVPRQAEALGMRRLHARARITIRSSTVEREIGLTAGLPQPGDCGTA